MATRGLIGYLDTDQSPIKLTSTYNHYDAYPEHLGVALENFFNSDSLAKDLANYGYITFISDKTGEIEQNHKQNPRRNTLTDNFNEAMLDIASEIDSFDADYGYIWCNENGEWITIKNNGIRGMANDLEMALAHLKGKFAMMPERPDQTNSHYVSNDEADEDARMNELFVHQMKYKAGIIK